MNSTPTKRRILTPSTTNSSSPSTTPKNHSTTPTSIKKPNPGASPQIKAALALLRAKKSSLVLQTQSPLSSPSIASLSPSTTSTTFNSLSARSSTTGLSSSNSTYQADDDLLNEDLDGGVGEGWAVKSIGNLVQSAKRSGRLNVSSRSLKKFPTVVLNNLIPLSSTYHSSSYIVPATLIDPSTVLFPSPTGSGYSPTKSSDSDSKEAEEDEKEELLSDIGSGQVDLKSLNVSCNEITEISERIAGLEDLVELDLHSNFLPSLPSSLFQLRFLTSLNLSHNPLETFPSEILRLNGLISLNLCATGLKKLWNVEWLNELEEIGITKLTIDSPSNSPNRRKYSHLLPSPPPILIAPTILQNLKHLDVSSNPLEPAWMLSIEFPKNLVSLDLSKCGLVSECLPISVFIPLNSLTTLNLAYNNLDPSLFKTKSFTFSHELPSWSPLGGLESLRRLDLSHNRIEMLGAVENGLLEVLRNKFYYTGIEDEKIDNLFRAGKTFRDYQKKTVVALEKRHQRNYSVSCKVVEPIQTDQQTETFEELEIIVWGNEISTAERIRRRSFFPSSAGSISRSINSPAPTPIIKEQVIIVAEGSKEEIPITPIKQRMEENNWDEAPLTEGGKRRARAMAGRLERERLEECLNQVKLVEPVVVEQMITPRVVEAEVEMVSEAAIESEKASEAEPELEVKVEVVDPNLYLLKEGFNSTTGSLNLASRSLSTYPSVSSKSTTSSIQPVIIDLSRNLFITFPISLSTHHFHSLTNLDLSYNKITSLFQPLPNLRILNLAYNSIKSLAGLENIVTSGLEVLKLNGNGIADIDELLIIAEKCKEKKIDLNLKVFDLSDNEISRLPYILGHLPNSLDFLVSGNTFRMPPPKIHQSSSSSVLLEWLKARDRS